MARRILLLVFALFLSLSTAAAQSGTTLTNADVIKMLQAGLEEGTVIEAIAASKTQFEVSLAALMALHQAGATDKLIQAMVNAQSPQQANVQPAGSLAGTPLAVVAPQNPLDAQAEALAKKVIAGGPEAREPLLTAMRLSGFNVRNLDRTFVLQQPSNATPIGFQTWQVAALAEPGRNLLVSMGTITSVLTEAFPVLKNVPLSVLLVQGIRKSATSRDPQERFWAQFIMALEHIPPNGYDLNSVQDPSQLYLDTVQTAFILHRLVGDIEILALANGQIVLPSQVEHRPAAWEYQFQNVAFDPANRPLFRLSSSPDGGAPPCSLDNELQENIVDLTAKGSAKGFDALMDYLKEHISSLESETGGLSPLEKYQSALGAAAIIMEYVKLLAIYAKGLHVKFEMDKNGPPLIRTHSDTTPDEKRIITATATLQPVPEYDWVNCLRNALALIGMEIPEPYKVGPLKDSAVAWDLIEGKPIVEFVGGADSLLMPTNEDGESPVHIEGRKQQHLIPDWAFPMKKEAEVEARVQIVRPSMREDFFDALENAPLDSILSILKVPAGMIKRSTLLSPFSYPFEVIDWKVKLELYFDSQIEMYNGREFYRVQSTVPIDIRFDPQASPRFASLLFGEAPLNQIATHFIGPDGRCDAEGVGGLGLLQVVGEIGSQRLSAQEATHVNLGLNFAGTLEQITAICPRGSVTVISGQWRGYFYAAHQNEFRGSVNGGRGFQVADWTPVNASAPDGSSVIARKTYDRSFGVGGHESTVIELRLPPDAQGEE